MWLRVLPTPAAAAAAANLGKTMQPCQNGALVLSPTAPSNGSDLTHLFLHRSRLDRLTPHRPGGVRLRKQLAEREQQVDGLQPGDLPGPEAGSALVVRISSTEPLEHQGSRKGRHMKRLMLVPVLVAALLAGLAVATVTADMGDNHVDRDGLWTWAVQVASQPGAGDSSHMIPALVIWPNVQHSIVQVRSISRELQASILSICADLTGQAKTDCDTHDVTGADWAGAVSHRFNYDISTYATAAEQAMIAPGTIPVFAGTLTPLMLTEAFRTLLLRGAYGVRPALTLAEFARCRYAVSHSLGGIVGDENSGDIIQNCTDVRHTDEGSFGTAAERNRLIRQLAYLLAVDPAVKVIVQDYCDEDINRTPSHYDQEPSEIRPVFSLDVKRCSAWFVADEYADLRAGWSQSYDTYQAWQTAWTTNFHAPSRPVVNGAAQVYVGKGIAHDPTPTDPGDGMVGPNTPPPITEVSAYDDNVPVEQTPHFAFDKDGYALVIGGLVHQYTPQGSTEVRCVFQGYDGSLYQYASCP